MWRHDLRAWVFLDGGMITEQFFEDRDYTERVNAIAARAISRFVYSGARRYTPPNGYGYCPTCASWIGHGTRLAAAYHPHRSDP